MDTVKIECPHCQTGYLPERCGLVINDRLILATIGCKVCGQSFDVAATTIITAATTVAGSQTWWERWLRRPVPQIQIPGETKIDIATTRRPE